MMAGASSAVPPLVSADLPIVRRTKYDGSSPDKDEDLLEGGRDGDRESCGGGLGGSYDGRSCQPHVLPPEFSACFSTKTREMRWGLWCKHDRQWMQLVKDNYEKHHRRRRQRQGVLPQSHEGCRSPRDDCFLIPRIIHHIWLGSPMPAAFARLRELWRTRHKDNWELKLWTETDVETFGLENRAAYDAAGNFGEKSDILRYEILLRHGGLYVDVDFLCLGAFDDLHRRYDFYTGVSNTGTFELNNGLVGCRPGHPIMYNIINRIRASSAPSLPPQQGTGHGTTSSTAAAFATVCNFEAVSPPEPPLPSSTTEGAVGVASSVEGINEGGWELEPGGGATAGNPLVGLIGSFGRMAGAGGGRGKGLLAELLGGEDEARLKEAVKVEPGSATATIVKTGPGLFTIAVMEWMASPAAVDGGAPCVAENVHHECSDAGSTQEKADRTIKTMMVLPPSFFYPVPNDTKGYLIGDGGEDGIRAGHAGRFLSEESLAAHLWGKSWQ